MNKQDIEKIERIESLCQELGENNRIYAATDIKSYFAYDDVIELLERALNNMTNSVRCPRPENIPQNMAWSERFHDSQFEFDPFVYDGSMSIEDYEKVSNAYLEDQDLEME